MGPPQWLFSEAGGVRQAVLSHAEHQQFFATQTSSTFVYIVKFWKTNEKQSSKVMIACRGGIVRVPNVKYNAKQLTLQPRLAWRGAMQVDPQGCLPYVYLYKQP